jgi:hypothetical protein
MFPAETGGSRAGYTAGLNALLIFPFDAVHVDFVMRAA